jgi:hypothetical protein
MLEDSSVAQFHAIHRMRPLMVGARGVIGLRGGRTRVGQKKQISCRREGAKERKMRNELLVLAMLTAGSMSVTGIAAESTMQLAQAQTNQSMPSNRNQGPTSEPGFQDGDPPIVVLVPARMYRETEAGSNGCWVRFFEGNEFTGPFVAVLGPTEMWGIGPALANVGFESVMVGPRARVHVFPEPQYHGQVVNLGPDQRIGQVNSSDLSQLKAIQSMKVVCDFPGQN